jgi:uncharacterized protein with GYD domain
MYILLGTMTYTGQRMLCANPDLMTDAVRTVDVPGAKILGHYAVLGEYDFVMMVEADDNATVARLSLELGVRTGIHLETLPAVAISVLAERDPKEREGQTEFVEGTPEEWKLPRGAP